MIPRLGIRGCDDAAAQRCAAVLAAHANLKAGLRIVSIRNDAGVAVVAIRSSAAGAVLRNAAAVEPDGNRELTAPVVVLKRVHEHRATTHSAPNLSA